MKGIEPSSLAWKAIALPLSYTRDGKGHDWGVQDSNLRRLKPSDLQSDPFDRSGNSPCLNEWCAFGLHVKVLWIKVERSSGHGRGRFGDFRSVEKPPDTGLRIRRAKLAVGLEPATC